MYRQCFAKAKEKVGEAIKVATNNLVLTRLKLSSKLFSSWPT